jgi:CAI-1 autoinducer synthase
MTQALANVGDENGMDARASELPALIRGRFERLRGRKMTQLLSAQGAPDRSGVHLFSNDYLAIANHPRIAQAILVATAGNIDSPWMSSVFFGEDCQQRMVEHRFAQYLGAEDTMLSQSGYCANFGLVQAIAGPGTRIYIDACAHASLWHGVLASRATPFRFAHNDPAALEALLAESGPGIVIVDTIYSHDGTVCPLREIIEVATRHECVLIIDESHSLGTHGPEGAGMVAMLGLEQKVHFRTASLAKAFVSRAGLVAASEAACWCLRYSAGPAIFSSACVSHDLAGLSCALEVITAADHRRRRLSENAAHLQMRLRELGYGIASSSHIVALESGLESETLRLRRFLEANGIYGSVFCAPVTRLDESLIRLSVHAGLSDSALDRVVDVCRKARDHIRFTEWASTRRERDRVSTET